MNLFGVEQGTTGQLAEWAPEFPAETACHAIETWLTGGGSKKAPGARTRRKRAAFPKDFADRFGPEWREMIGRILSRKR